MPKVTSVAVVDDFQELVDGFNNVVGGEDGDDGLGIAPGDDGGAVADGVEGVAPGRFAQKLFPWQTEGVADQVGMSLAGADIPVFGGNEPFEAIKSKLEKAFAVDERDELFGQAGPAHGPKAGTGTAGDDQCISHRG